MVAKSALPNPTKSEIFGSSMLLPTAASEESFHFHPSSFSSFLPLSMAKSDEGKKMGAPASLRDGILPCVPIPLGLLNAFTLSLFLSLPAASHMWIPQAPS
ncbi:hypothetical protein Pyn_39069 [Prunus yedoensis var. nudiflora]|uniref:Uncharacterized protein n=1 Tax=Prunus yedoensis var. nudiflora TaxID=2094558 RepID=A0A314YJ44_PRUYE|nr:hypothetical protein Pyn_39069 [Prunus yedoensis var. nudiflora]